MFTTGPFPTREDAIKSIPVPTEIIHTFGHPEALGYTEYRRARIDNRQFAVENSAGRDFIDAIKPRMQWLMREVPL